MAYVSISMHPFVIIYSYQFYYRKKITIKDSKLPFDIVRYFIFIVSNKIHSTIDL